MDHFKIKSIIAILLLALLMPVYATDDETEAEKKEFDLPKYYAWEVVYIPDDKTQAPTRIYFHKKSQVRKYYMAVRETGIVIYRDRSDFSSKWRRMK